MRSRWVQVLLAGLNLALRGVLLGGAVVCSFYFGRDFYFKSAASKLAMEHQMLLTEEAQNKTAASRPCRDEAHYKGSSKDVLTCSHSRHVGKGIGSWYYCVCERSEPSEAKTASSGR